MFKVKIAPRTGAEPFKVEVDYGDAYVWEKTGKGRSLPDIAGALPAVPMYELALIACKRLGKVAPEVKIEEWAPGVVCTPIQGDDDDDDDAEPNGLDPTNPAPSTSP